ncbi:unnamed protein product [Boreogadus saida]
MADVYGAPPPEVLQHAAAHPRFNRRSKTYLAMIACVLQDVPGKMLTFSQLMEKLEEFVTGDRKCFENNIRVCLSYSKCFVKNPMYPQMPSCKLNYWKLDHSQITVKMVHRHFRKILDQFPELAPKMAKWPLPPQGSPGPVTTVPHTPEPADCKAPPARGSIKFRGPFSIESLLRRDSPSRLGPKPPPPPPPAPQRSGQAAELEQQAYSPGDCGDEATGWLSWDYLPVETLLPGSDKRWPFHHTWCNVRVGDPGARPFKRMCWEPSAPVSQQRDCQAPYVAGPQSNPMSRYLGDVHHFRL